MNYERPRCKVIITLPFGLFIAKRVRLLKTEGNELNPGVNPRP